MDSDLRGLCEDEPSVGEDRGQLAGVSALPQPVDREFLPFLSVRLAVGEPDLVDPPYLVESIMFIGDL